MASHVFVIDSSARRQQIKTTPATYLHDVLEEACKRFNKDPEQFVLSDNGRPPKTLDLSLTIRLSGLVNGAKLQLTQASRSPSVINVALKLPQAIGGQRLQDKFPSNTSLWLVLRKFEEAVAGGVTQKLNLTQRGVPSTEAGAGRLEYEQPVVKIMQRELSDFVGLQKTLAQLGYNSGSVLLQLEFTRSGLPMEEAIARISQYFNPSPPQPLDGGSAKEASSKEVSSSDAHSAAAGTSSLVPDVAGTDTTSTPSTMLSTPDLPIVSSTSEDVEMTPAPPIVEPPSSREEPAPIASSSKGPTDGSQTADEAEAPPPSDPSISVYKPPSASTPRAALQPPSESDFTPTVEHAQAHQAVLARAAQNRRLRSDAEMAAEEASRLEALSAVTKATIRVRFPNQMLVELGIGPDDTAATLYGQVRGMLADATLGFELRYTGAKGAPIALERAAERSLIRSVGWKGRVLVTMVWDPDVPLEKRDRVLKDSLLGQARELEVPEPVVGGGVERGQGKALGEAKVGQGNKPKGKGDLEAKMKKFLGFGKK